MHSIFIRRNLVLCLIYEHTLSLCICDLAPFATSKPRDPSIKPLFHQVFTQDDDASLVTCSDATPSFLLVAIAYSLHVVLCPGTLVCRYFLIAPCMRHIQGRVCYRIYSDNCGRYHRLHRKVHNSRLQQLKLRY